MRYTIKHEKEKVKELLEEKIGDVFLIRQDAFNIEIKSGDIEPLMAHQLEVLADRLSELIAEVVWMQRLDSYEKENTR